VPKSAGLSAVIVSDFAHVNGGAAQVAIVSAIGLARRGIPVAFVYAAGPADERLMAAGIRLVPVATADIWSIRNPLKAARNGIWNSRAADGLGCALAGSDPARTIVHFHQWTKAFSPSVLKAALVGNFPAAITLHDYFLACPTGCYYDFPAQAPCTLRPMSTACLCRNCDSRSPAHKAVRVIRHVALSRAVDNPANQPAAIHVSRAAAAVAKPILPAGMRHYVVPNPVDETRSRRTPAEANVIYAFVGRLTREKGCLAFARAARRAGVKASFAGTGPCADMIRRENPDAQLLGWLSRDRLRELFDRTRVLVFPSRWHETSGLVCAEALACGVPVLAARITAAADLIEPGVNGGLFDPEDEDELTARISDLQDPALVERMSRAAFERYWASPQDLDAHVDALLVVYHNMLERDRATHASETRS
jgi:glycosyltransferase involved in cell wall biosynthesis